MIVVADDLGAGNGVDDAILRALGDGVVDAASVLVNGAGFADAASEASRFPGRIGVHLVLTEGEPVTDAMRRLPRFCDGGGRYRPWRGGERAFRLARQERAVLAAELRAQVRRARDAGLAVAHLDSHHHVHTEPGIAPVVIALARELGVPRVRIARNCGSGMGTANRAWKAILNTRLRRAGLAGTRWFGGVDDYRELQSRRGDVESFELMVHPVCADGQVVDSDHPEAPLARLLDR